MNSRTLLSMSWYLAVALVICWMMVVTWPKIVAYSRAENIMMINMHPQCHQDFNVQSIVNIAACVNEISRNTKIGEGAM